MKKVCILIQSLSAGGAEKQACILARELASRCDVTVVTAAVLNSDSKNVAILESASIHVSKLNSSGAVGQAWEFYKLVRHEKYDAIISYLMWGATLGGVVGKLAGVKIRIGGVRNAVLPGNKKWVNRLMQNWFNTLTIYNNHRGYDELSKQGFKASRALVIPNSIDVPPMQDERLRNQIPVILSVGRFVEQKDYSSALKVVKQLVDRGLTFKYVIVGYGVLESEIRQSIKELDLSHCVEIVINPPKVQDFYFKADIYFQTSLFEGLSNTVMEAMSCSLPCVVSDAGDNAHIIEEGKGGYVTQQKDLHQMEERLYELLLNPERRIAFGAFNRAKVWKTFAIDAFRTKYFELLNL